MWLTINLDADLYHWVKSISVAEDISLNAAVNKLLRQTAAAAPPRRTKKRRFPTSRGKRRFTSNEVYRIEQKLSA
jgi:hypothetical protein